MAKKTQSKTFEDSSNWFRDHEFEITEAPGTSGRVFLKKYSVSAAIERADDGGVKIFAYPGYLVGGEISKLVDLGNQKVLKTTKTEIAATADHLKALHQFAEELKDYPCSKGTIRFAVHKPLPKTLVDKLVRARVAKNEAKKRK